MLLASRPGLVQSSFFSSGLNSKIYFKSLSKYDHTEPYKCLKQRFDWLVTSILFFIQFEYKKYIQMILFSASVAGTVDGLHQSSEKVTFIFLK